MRYKRVQVLYLKKCITSYMKVINELESQLFIQENTKLCLQGSQNTFKLVLWTSRPQILLALGKSWKVHIFLLLFFIQLVGRQFAWAKRG